MVWNMLPRRDRALPFREAEKYRHAVLAITTLVVKDGSRVEHVENLIPAGSQFLS